MAARSPTIVFTVPLATTELTVASAVPIVVLVSGEGTNLQALIDAAANPSYGVRIAAVGADRTRIEGLARAECAGIPTFVVALADYGDRADWDAALTAEVAAFNPELVVLAGFMKLAGPTFLAQFGGRTVNTHPALSPAFPGMNAPADALAHGVKVTGATLFVVDAGVDTGPIVAQVPVPVEPDDTASTLHERIKTSERSMLVEWVGRLAREPFTLHHRTITFGELQ